MRAQEIELWARDVVEAVIRNQPVEDSRVELKANWIEPGKAAKQLAGHANASRGEPILWLIGVDERNATVSGVDPVEFEGWYKQVQRWFDGYAPDLVIHTNVRIEDHTVVALYFDTAQYAPYVVTNDKGGYPEFSVPWRDGTRIRAARRDELLRLLLPIVKQPHIRLATAELGLRVSAQAISQRKHTWTFTGLVYITPADGSRVAIPYAQCAVWMLVKEYSNSPYRLTARFGPANPAVNKPQRRQTIKLMGNDVDITPPPPLGSFTIKCGDTELLADGPGSARLTAGGYVAREDLPMPTGNISITIEITPSNTDRPIVLKATLKPVKSQFAVSPVYKWTA